MTTERLELLQADLAAALIDARLAPTIASVWSGGEHTAERLGLYRGNIFVAWEKSLSNAFPVIRAIVGAAFFTALARAYGYAHPSTCGDLNRFGDKFPDFILSHDRTQSLPYLGDIAALEWSVHRAYFAADITPILPAHLASLSPHALLAHRFSVQPACAWFSSRYPIVSIWAAHQPHPSAELPNTLDHGEHALVYRSNWHARVSISSKSEIAALTQLREGEKMETAIQCALNIDADYDAAHALLRWLDFGLLSKS